MSGYHHSDEMRNSKTIMQLVFCESQSAIKRWECPKILLQFSPESTKTQKEITLDRNGIRIVSSIAFSPKHRIAGWNGKSWLVRDA